MKFGEKKSLVSKVCNEASFKYHRDILPNFTSIYEPILKIGLFSFIGYFRINQCGEYLIPVSKGAHFVKNYFENVESPGFYLEDQYRRVQHSSIIPLLDPRSQNDTPLDYVQSLGLGSGIMTIKRINNEIEGISYYFKNNELDIKNIPFSEKELFKKISEEISEKASLILKSNQEVHASFKDPINITPYPGDVLLQEKLNCILAQLRKDNAMNLQNIYSTHDISLTPRQIQVILASIHGETSKEAARKLLVHYRTVETHWADIQRKFTEKTGFFYSRSQIIETFLENADKYLNNSESSALIQDVQNYRNSLKVLTKHPSHPQGSLL